jgi:hypothetical protein
MLISYVYSNKGAFSQSSFQLVSVRYNNIYGRKLKKIYYTLFNIQKQKSTVYNHSNLNNNRVAKNKIQNFYIQMDNICLQ